VIHSAAQGERPWWADLAPSVPAATAAGLWNGKITGYDRPIDVTLRVRGERVGAVGGRIHHVVDQVDAR
jgi:hypothetical protein